MRVPIGSSPNNTVRTDNLYFCLDLEWMLGQIGAVPSEMEESPRKKVHDVMESTIRSTTGAAGGEDDW